MINNLKTIKEAVLSRPYNYILIITSLIYLVANTIINQVYVTAPILFTYNLKIIIPYIIFTLSISLLVGVNVSLMYHRYRKSKIVRKEGSVTFLGIFSGILGGACPSCFVGLFPAFMALFGITASLSSLPFYGLELQVLAILILIISMILLSKEQKICKVNFKK